jgi:xanthine/uracil permease
MVQIAAIILTLYGLCPKFGALLAAMPRSVLGGVFIIVCGMIVMSGVRLYNSVPNTTSNFLLGGITLICALGIPVYAKYGLGTEWLKQLPALLRLFMTNTVVLAVFLGVGLNIILNTDKGKTK